MPAGLFISFEGTEGCGKSTQILRLADRLRRSGRTVRVTREPGGTPVGEQIRQLLQFSQEGRALAPEAELLLFAASRAQLVREVIAPALAGGEVVLADRFLDSTTVYQGVARQIAPGPVGFINEFAVGGAMPDLTLLLDLDNATARARMLSRPATAPDRMEQQPEDFYERVRTGYRALAEAAPERVRRIDASPAADAVEAAVWKQVQEKLHGILARCGS